MLSPPHSSRPFPRVSSTSSTPNPGTHVLHNAHTKILLKHYSGPQTINGLPIQVVQKVLGLILQLFGSTWKCETPLGMFIDSQCCSSPGIDTLRGDFTSYSCNNRVAGHRLKKQLQRKQLGVIVLDPTKPSVVPVQSTFAVPTGRRDARCFPTPRQKPIPLLEVPERPPQTE